MIKAVIFDVDGTLVNSVDSHAHAWQDAFNAFGHDFAFDKIRSQIGKGGDQLMPVFLSHDEVEAQGPDIERFRTGILKERYFPGIRGFPKVRELFEKLIAGNIEIVLASSAKKDELQFYKQAAGIEDLVEKETSSDDADKSKPHPDIFEAALALLHGIDKTDILVVGDTPYDAEAAGKVGLRTVGVLCGGFAEEDLRAAGCVAIYRDAADLLERLAI
jgi:phosphoglycolate phosphatase-like HAD superfamily hydrolase